MSFSESIIDRTRGQTMPYFTCTMISSVDLARTGCFVLKIWVSGGIATRNNKR